MCFILFWIIISVCYQYAIILMGFLNLMGWAISLEFDGMGYGGQLLLRRGIGRPPHDNNQYAFIVSRSYLNMGNKNSKSQDNASNRTFHLNQPHEDYGSNQVKTTNSTVLTFIPKNLFHQFSNLPNLYFFLICILQVIPEISVTDGQPTTLVPLSVVILTVMIKDAYEQFGRFLKDREQNNRETQLLEASGFQPNQWDQIEVGKIFKVKEDQLIPCDGIVLKTNLPENKCFIETKSLDGETNLKSRKAPLSRYKLDNVNNRQLYHKRYKIQMEPPNEFLNKINGFMDIEREQVPISIDNVILRGCQLKNCAEAICVAIYVGSDTKVRINSVNFEAKKSKMMIEIDKMVISIFIWQLLISLIVSLFNTLFESSDDGVMYYIQKTTFWLLVPSWWLMMTYFVPISLIVTMQLIKLFQGGAASKDIKGFSHEYNCYMSVNNTSINQNLGQIKYVFTDKTGTLTKNQMSFKKIVLDGQKYGIRTDISEQQIAKNYPKTQFVSFRDSTFLNNLSSSSIQDYLRILYLCHDIYVDTKSTGKVQYNSSSPDQIALINFAKLCGKELLGEQDGYIKIYDHHNKNTIKFQKLALLEFSSDRKRMSVIVRTPSNEILMVTKGADSAVQKILRAEQKQLSATNKRLEEFSTEGLRTLMTAHRIIPEKQYKEWEKIYKKAQTSIQNRQQSLQQAYQLIQKNLVLVGGTAVEDKLQDDVQGTIINMKRAGIKFFILTGDKKQTAINIGRSSGLLDSKARIISYPEQFTEENKNYRGDKVYLIDASGPLPQLPIDLFQHQTICYRCTPIQKANIVKYVKEKSPDLTLAIGDGANDVNMIIAADVGIGVKGKQGTQATRVSDVSIGQFKFLQLLTLYYGRQWYRKNARLVYFNFFKNWYHVSAVLTYGAYSFYSAQQIFDIYAYELFNAFFASFPIMVYAVYDEEFNYDQSKKYGDIYQPGLLGSQFNQKIYYKTITQGLLYGFVSIIFIFMILEDDLLTADARVGYFKQSGAVLFFNILLVINFKVLIMSNGVSIALILSVMFGLCAYWAVYYFEVLLLDFQLDDSFYQQWETPLIYLVHLMLVFMLIMVDLGITVYQSYKDRGNRLLIQKSRNFLVGQLLEQSSFKKRRK